MKKAQTSAEFLIIFSIALAILLLALIISQEQVSDVNKAKAASDARNTVDDLASAAREVYAQGVGAKKEVFVRIPPGYDPSSSFVRNKTILMKVDQTDYAAVLEFNVRGSLPKTPGGHWVWVVSEGNRVRIGDAMMELDKNVVYLLMKSNSTANSSFSVKNIWIRDINISTKTTWTSSEVTMSGVPPTLSLRINETNVINLNFEASANSTGLHVGRVDLIATDGVGSTERVDLQIIVEVVPSGRYSEDDKEGPVITSIFQEPMPATKFQQLTIFINATDEYTGNSTISGCEIDHDNLDDWQATQANDGAYDQPTEVSKYDYLSGFALGPHTIRARCSDAAGNTGPTAYYYFNITEADTLGPIVLRMNHTEWPTTLSNVSVGGQATDEYTGNSNVQSCNVKIDSGTWNPATPIDGAWDSPNENFTYNVGPLPAGHHTVYYQCTDSLGNVGGIYNDSFGIVDVDLMIVLDRSGSMADNLTNAVDKRWVSASSTGWSWVKNLKVEQKNGDLATLTVSLKTSRWWCTGYYKATINGIEVSTGSTTGTSYKNIVSTINVSNFTAPYQIALWLKRSGSSCTVYNNLLSLQQPPTKMTAVKNSSKSFLDIAGNNIQAGLVSYSTSATTDRRLAMMTPANQQALKNAIDALSPSGYTCIECGLRNAADELVSARARPLAKKVIILLTDGRANRGDSVAGAVYCRERNITVYTIGFGYDVDDVELTNIALLAHGDYYFAPNAETLNAIFLSIGK